MLLKILSTSLEADTTGMDKSMVDIVIIVPSMEQRMASQEVVSRLCPSLDSGEHFRSIKLVLRALMAEVMTNSLKKGSRGQTTRATIAKVVRAMVKGHSSKSISIFVVELVPREAKEGQDPLFVRTTRARWPQRTKHLPAQTASLLPC